MEVAVAASKYQEFGFEELTHVIGQVAAVERLARVELLGLVRAISARSELGDHACENASAWLCMQLGMSPSTARDIENVAIATAHLPRLLNTFATGELSWDKLVLCSRFACAATDAEWAENAPAMSIRQLRKFVRDAQLVSDEDAVEILDMRNLNFRSSHGGRAMRISGSLPAEMGAVARAEVERVADETGPDENGNYLPAHQQSADALVEICSTRLAQNSQSHRSKVVIHGDLAVLSERGTAQINYEGLISSGQFERLMCSASVELAIMHTGKTIGSGRATRLFPPKVVEAIMNRDQGCRFVGCNRRRWLQAHHVREWVRDRGESNEDNGIMLCWHHHTFVHERGWRIEGSVYGALRFIRPDGKAFTGMPPPLDPEVGKRIRKLLDAC